MSLIAEGFSQLFNCSGDPAGTQPAPEDDDICHDRRLMLEMTGTPSESFASDLRMMALLLRDQG